ncbi:MAG TPA: hypothetical protein VFZ00_02410 [Solirubrobacter sp.]|nr:hypothetical protein [Solirubrobacter sp.]
MRRTIFMALLAALLLVPATAHAAGPIQIIRDCEDDGELQGNYTAAELRKARSELPTDIDEYSDCRDVISRAISAKTSTAKDTSGGGSGGGGTGGGGTSTGGGPGTGEPTTGGTSTVPTPEPIVAPETAEDAAALEQAAKVGGEPVEINGRPVSPGASRLAAHIGRNDLPATQIALLALLLIGALAGAATALIRGRGLANRQA